MKKNRQSNFELLRIFSMILIIACHFYGSDFDWLNLSAVNKAYLVFIGSGGNIGNDIFILISGYFLVKTQDYKIYKKINLWIQIFTYSLMMLLLSKMFDFSYIGNHLSISFSINNLSHIGINNLIHSIFPIAYNQWWFASTYFMLFLLSPFINKALTGMTKSEYRNMLILVISCWCILPSLTHGNITYCGNNLLWFITVYSTAGYIRLHADTTNISGKKYIGIAVISYVLWFIFISLKIPQNFFIDHLKIGLFDNENIPVFAIALLLFIGFMKINIKENKFINLIASSTFGIYLIHESNYMRNFLWNVIFRYSGHVSNELLIPYSIIVISIVFISCSTIEITRKKLFEPIYSKKIEQVANYLDKKTKD